MFIRPRTSPPVLPSMPLSREQWAAVDFQRLCWFVAQMPQAAPQRRRRLPKWAHRLHHQNGSPACAVCGTALETPSTRRRPNEIVLSPVIPPTVGGHAIGRMLLWLCRTCEATRQGRDVVSWPEARANKKRWAAIAALRMQALPFCANHATRHPWRTAPPVLRTLHERWQFPRSAVFVAWRDQWDNGASTPAHVPFDGWIFWPTGHPPSGLARLILGQAGWRAWPEPIPGWEGGTVAGERMRDTLWSLIDANTWLRRVALAPAPYACAEPVPPSAFDRAAWDSRVEAAQHEDWRSGLIWGPRMAEAETARDAAASAHATATAAYTAAVAEWHRWPPAGCERGPDDDWWHTHWSVGQCLRRRPSPPRRGRFAPRRPGARPRPRRQRAGGGAG